VVYFAWQYKKERGVPGACWNNVLYEMVNDYVNLFPADVNKNDAILIKYLKTKNCTVSLSLFSLFFSFSISKHSKCTIRTITKLCFTAVQGLGLISGKG